MNRDRSRHSLLVVKSLRKLEYVWIHPGNEGHRVRALARSLSFLSWHRLTGKPMTVDLGEHSHIIGYPDSYGGASAIYGNPGPDFREVAFWRNLVRPGDVMLDVGANEGLYTILFAEMGAEVTSFEPDPTAAERLLKNLRLNGYSAEVRPEAVYSSTGHISFTSDRGTSNAIIDKTSGGQHTHMVPTTTLDEVLGSRHARGVKVDVEGAEFEVLKGAEIAMAEGRVDVFQLEWNDMSSSYGISREDIGQLLRSYDYELFRPRSDGSLTLTSTEIGSDVIAIRRGVEPAR
jgi:FkbM family methyltransferase